MASVGIQEAEVTEPGEVERYGRYEIVEKLAMGGMGEVFLARAIGAAGFQKHVVIKKILPHLVEQKQFVDGLVREAKLLLMLDHPNIVQVLDLGMEGKDYFMAMEFVPGYNLATIAHYCAQTKLLIPAQACASMALSVLAALEYAHGVTGPDGEIQNIIHRDVSPQNVLLSREGRVKLTDFGIAKVLNAAEGEFTQSLKGKFRYMAPEAIEGGRMDRRYDLFAAGILLFEALCRRHLFGGRSDIEILNQVKATKVPSIARYHPEVPQAIQDVVIKSLRQNPDERYQTAGEFSAALREAMRPVAESDAASQLRAFIADLYARDDFPINRSKLPDLQAAPKPGTRSIMLRSYLPERGVGETPAEVLPAPRRGNAAIIALSLALLAIGGVVAYLAYTVLSPEKGPRIDAKREPDIIIVRPRQGADAGSTAPKKDAKIAEVPEKKPPRPKPRPRPIRFTDTVGSRAFAKQTRRLMRCFNDHTQPGAPGIKFSVVSKISAAGKVRSVKLDPASHQGTALGSCVLRVARRVRYPRHNQPEVTFVQPLAIRRDPGTG